MFKIDYDLDGHTQLKLTQSGLKSLGQIWNVVPKFKRGSLVKKDEAIFTFEVTSGLKNILCPVSGKVFDYAESMCLETPEKISEYTTLVTLTGVNSGAM